jgi:hypothetical protein
VYIVGKFLHGGVVTGKYNGQQGAGRGRLTHWIEDSAVHLPMPLSFCVNWHT